MRFPRVRIPGLFGVRVALPLAIVVVLVGLSAGALLTHTAVELARFERTDARRTTFVHAAGQALVPGLNVSAVDLTSTLTRLQYVETRATPVAPGQFRRSAGAWDIVLRSDDVSPGRTSHGLDRVRLDLRGERVSRVVHNGEPVRELVLGGEVLTGAGDRPGEDYRPVRFADVPLRTVRAFLAAEDHRFFEHRGLDLVGLARAAWTNVRAGRVRQGGSTITQQLVKNRLLTPRRTFLRKLDEAWLAAVIDWRYPKERILEGYLNEIYLGQHGATAIRGIGAAARAFFGKEVHQLTLGESALMAGMTRAPNTYSPAVNPARARERRDAVLAQLRELGWITAADEHAAAAEPVRAQRSSTAGQPAPYFTDFVHQELEQRLGDDPLLETRGVHVTTTLDLPLQRFAEAALARGLDRLETRYPRLRRRDPAERLQGAIVVLDATSGQVKALVGGRDYAASQFNRATLAHRQPGSAFKPFVYVAGLTTHRGAVDDGHDATASSAAPAVTAASLVDDSPIVLTVDGKPWTPRNYDDRYEGVVSVRQALAHSLNAATVRVAQMAGLPAVVQAARGLGIQSPLVAVPAIALGSFEVTPFELARAYVPFASGGAKPHGSPVLVAVRSIEGGTADFGDERVVHALTPAESYLMTSLLGTVIESGTGSAARGLAANGVLAGKTGTTNDARDAWFVGYSPSLLAVVWVGFDGGQAHGLSGADAALPIWIDFMRHALDAYPAPAPFAVPAGIEFANVDPTTGKVANRYCPVVAREVFLAGTEPPVCTEHGGVADQIGGWWRRFRDWLTR